MPKGARRAQDAKRKEIALEALYEFCLRTNRKRRPRRESPDFKVVEKVMEWWLEEEWDEATLEQQEKHLRSATQWANQRVKRTRHKLVDPNDLELKINELLQMTTKDVSGLYQQQAVPQSFFGTMPMISSQPIAAPAIRPIPPRALQPIISTQQFSMQPHHFPSTSQIAGGTPYSKDINLISMPLAPRGQQLGPPFSTGMQFIPQQHQQQQQAYTLRDPFHTMTSVPLQAQQPGSFYPLQTSMQTPMQPPSGQAVPLPPSTTQAHISETHTAPVQIISNQGESSIGFMHQNAQLPRPQAPPSTQMQEYPTVVHGDHVDFIIDGQLTHPVTEQTPNGIITRWENCGSFIPLDDATIIDMYKVLS